MARKKNSGRITDLTKPFIGHRKHTKLIYRTEPVFNRSYHTIWTARITFKIKYAIHHMLKNSWPSQCTFFSNMPDQKQCDIMLFGKTHELCGTFTHLGH